MKGNSGIATGGDLQTFSLEDIGLTAQISSKAVLIGIKKSWSREGTNLMLPAIAQQWLGS